ncbi:hypothetical protein CXG81DRAFT_18799 [Caulochytrium protostelioides]|uniref:Uncharacterized protein n=1 Tax=Caulochytrium protostelioides TaxID=1555241 RepID=A0A4P9X809_9FUNG|nr:hypothetical protein CXG81DRAFT_18799 [Caulochytrium protostelioides]|eukprot:RKP01378.1 hypothetical protein CXG81DRAFT_18799 [Caulochytrium protostelioides]
MLWRDSWTWLLWVCLAMSMMSPTSRLASAQTTTTAGGGASSASSPTSANSTVVNGALLNTTISTTRTPEPPKDCTKCGAMASTWMSRCKTDGPAPSKPADYQKYAWDVAECICPYFRGNADVQSCIMCTQTSLRHASTPSTMLLTQISADCQPGSIRKAANDILLAVGAKTTIPADSPLVNNNDSSKKSKSSAARVSMTSKPGHVLIMSLAALVSGFLLPF